jgi:hypothetical protein
MARVPRIRKIAKIMIERVGSEYEFAFEDDGGKTLRLSATSDQALTLADMLDDHLAAEEMEQEAGA